MSDIRGQFCEPCLERGHQCPAHDEIDGAPWCIFCIDGVECPKAKKMAPTFNQDFVERRMAEHRKACESHVERAAENQEGDKDMPVFTNCKTCGKDLTLRNRSGYCTKHFYDSKRKSPAPTTKVEHGASLSLSEAQVDRFFSLLPAEKKFELVSAFLSLE